MGANNWYGHTEWTPEAAEYFWTKFKRARYKAQRLRVQASILAEGRATFVL